jgi:hypothetical protein
MLWQAKNSSGSYVDMKTPSTYKIDYEDLDSNSYRSVTNGNLIRSRLSSKWFKGSFTFNYLEESELENILSLINQYPLYVKVKSPMFGANGMIEIEAYVSKVSVEMLKNNPKETNGSQWVSLSFNIVQTKVVAGQ